MNISDYITIPPPVQPSITGWKPYGPDEETDFKKKIIAGVCGEQALTSGSVGNSAKEPSIGQIQKTIEAAALSIPHTTKFARAKDLRVKPQASQASQSHPC